MNEAAIHESPPAKEPIDKINSPALQVRIALGRFDTNPIGENPQLPPTVDQKSLDALHNQNVAQRVRDAKTFEQKYQNAQHPFTPEELRQEQMKAWSFGVISELGSDLHREGRGDKTAIILRDKLHIPLTATEGDGKILLNQLYDADTKKEGNFYKNFCTGNMNANLANALTVDDMMHLKTFLTKWMLGSEDAFEALVMLRQTQDSLKDSTQRTTLKDAPLTDRDSDILAYYQAGLNMGKDQEKEKKEPIQSVQ